MIVLLEYLISVHGCVFYWGEPERAPLLRGNLRKMVGWSMRDKQRRKTGMQHTSVVW